MSDPGAAPQATNIRLVRHSEFQWSLVACDWSANPEQHQARFRVRVWRRPHATDGDTPAIDRSFVCDVPSLTNVVVDPGSRLQIAVLPVRRDGAAYSDAATLAPTTLLDQFVANACFHVALRPRSADEYAAALEVLRTYKPAYSDALSVARANILIANQRGAGKSSFICSTLSVLNGVKYVAAAAAHPVQGGGGVTAAFADYVSPQAPGVVLWDSPGVTFDALDMDAMCTLFEYVVLGRIKLPYAFAGRDRAPTADELREKFFNARDAPLADRVHVVALVFDATTFANERSVAKLRRLAEKLGKHCQVVGIVTGADRLRRSPLVGNVNTGVVDEFEIENNLERVHEFAESNTHLLELAKNAEMDTRNVILTSNLCGMSPTHPDAFGRCVLTLNALRTLLDRADDHFTAEYTSVVRQMRAQQ